MAESRTEHHSPLTGNSIKFYLCTYDDPRIGDLADALGCSELEALGTVAQLQVIGSYFAPEGLLSHTPRQLKRALRSDLEANQLATALVQTGYLEDAGDGTGYHIVDWGKTCRELVENRANNAERQRNRRARLAAEQAAAAASVTPAPGNADVPVTPPRCNADVPVTTDPVTPLVHINTDQLKPSQASPAARTPTQAHAREGAGQPVPLASPSSPPQAGPAALPADASQKERAPHAQPPPSQGEPPAASQPAGFQLPDDKLDAVANLWRAINPLLNRAWLAEQLSRQPADLPLRALANANDTAMEEVKRRLAITDANSSGYVKHVGGFAARCLADAIADERGLAAAGRQKVRI